MSKTYINSDAIIDSSITKSKLAEDAIFYNLVVDVTGTFSNHEMFFQGSTTVDSSEILKNIDQYYNGIVYYRIVANGATFVLQATNLNILASDMQLLSGAATRTVAGDFSGDFKYTFAHNGTVFIAQATEIEACIPCSLISTTSNEVVFHTAVSSASLDNFNYCGSLTYKFNFSQEDTNGNTVNYYFNCRPVNCFSFVNQDDGNKLVFVTGFYQVTNSEASEGKDSSTMTPFWGYHYEQEFHWLRVFNNVRLQDARLKNANLNTPSINGALTLNDAAKTSLISALPRASSTQDGILSKEDYAKIGSGGSDYVITTATEAPTDNDDNTITFVTGA